MVTRVEVSIVPRNMAHRSSKVVGDSWSVPEYALISPTAFDVGIIIEAQFRFPSISSG